jgi:predicted transcriptional regulator
MSQTITVRLSKDLSAWLEETAARTGVSQGQIIREQLEQVRGRKGGKAFMRWAGVMRGPKNLSSRKGFSAK